MDTFDTIVTAICLGGVVPLCAVMMVRNQLVYNARRRRSDEIYQYSGVLIAEGTRAKYPISLWSVDDYGKYSYSEMMWMFRCWTYKQFYPRPVEETLASYKV